MTTMLQWEPVEYDKQNRAADLVFRWCWTAGPYMIFPTGVPEHIDQVWTVEYGTREIGRYKTLDDAREAAQRHHWNTMRQ